MICFFCINRVTPVAGWFMMDNRIYSHTVFFTPVPDLYGNHQIAWLMCQYDNYTYALYTVYYIQMMYILIITRRKFHYFGSMVLPGNGRSIPELVGKHFTTGDLLQVMG